VKNLINFIAPTIKAIVQVFVYMAGLGWIAYGAVYMIVKAEGQEIRREVKQIRDIDMSYIAQRFDRIEKLIKEQK
jgi:hypothetical protein